MTLPLDPYSEVVDERRRWMPEWYTFLVQTDKQISGAVDIFAPIASPTFTGNPTGPTPPPGDNDTSVATTAFVTAAIAAAVAALPSQPLTTGDAKFTYKTVADAGWIIADDGSIGNASSGATRANADTSALFTLMWSNIPSLIVQNSSGATVARGANGPADFAANRRLVIPQTLSRSLAVAGAGTGLTVRGLGTTAGAETETPTIAKMASHNHPGSSSTAYAQVDANANWTASGINGLGTSVVTVAAQGGGGPLSILGPSTYLNLMIKL